MHLVEQVNILIFIIFSLYDVLICTIIKEMSTGPKSIKNAIDENKAAIEKNKAAIAKHRRWIGRLAQYERTVKNNVVGIADNKNKLKTIDEKLQKNLDRIDRNFDETDRRDLRDRKQLSFLIRFLADKYPDFKGKWEENEKKRKEERSEEMAVDALTTIGRKTIKISKF